MTFRIEDCPFRLRLKMSQSLIMKQWGYPYTYNERKWQRNLYQENILWRRFKIKLTAVWVDIFSLWGSQ